MDSQDATAVALEEVIVAGAYNQQCQKSDIRGSNGIATGGT